MPIVIFKTSYPNRTQAAQDLGDSLPVGRVIIHISAPPRRKPTSDKTLIYLPPTDDLPAWATSENALIHE